MVLKLWNGNMLDICSFNNYQLIRGLGLTYTKLPRLGIQRIELLLWKRVIRIDYLKSF